MEGICMMKNWKLKKAGALLLAVYLMAAILMTAGLRIDAFAEEGVSLPNIIATVSGTNELHGGETEELTIKIVNTNPLSYARDIMFIPVNKYPFNFVEPVSEMPVKLLTADTPAEFKISAEIDKFVISGVYSLEFKLEYLDPWNNKQTNEYQLQVKIINNKTNGKIVIQPKNNTTANSGGQFELAIEAKNAGDLSVKDIKINLDYNDKFMLASGNDRVNIDLLKGKEAKQITYTLKASSLPSGSYPLVFSIEYTDEKGTVITDKQTIWIPVSGHDGVKTVLEVIEVTPSKTTITPSDILDVTVKIKNSGEFDSGQVKISADGTTALLPVSQNLHILQSIKKGETKVITFRFQARPDATRGGVPITIRVEPVDNTDGAVISQAISVFVDADTTGGTEPGKSVPKLIIQSYSSDPTLVNAGENFNLTMKFMNTHSVREIRNIKGSFSVTATANESGNVFTPVGSSNTFYIDKISPRDTADWNVTLYTIPDAKSKTYTVTISFEYEDDMGNSYTASEIIGIPVYQPSRFEVSGLSFPPETFMGQSMYSYIEMYNLGKTEIYNVKMRVEGDFDAQPKSSYFGNFESGRVEYTELVITPMMPGMSSGRVIFEYEDASGEIHEVVEEFTINVMEMDFPVDFPIDEPGGKPGFEEQPQKSFFKSVWFYVIIGVVVAAIVVVIIVVVSRKRKKNKEFDF